MYMFSVWGCGVRGRAEWEKNIDTDCFLHIITLKIFILALELLKDPARIKGKLKENFCVVPSEWVGVV